MVQCQNYIRDILFHRELNLRKEGIRFALKMMKNMVFFRGIANVELICENRMVIHIVPDEEDFDTVYQSLKNPPQYLALGRYEDLLDIRTS